MNAIIERSDALKKTPKGISVKFLTYIKNGTKIGTRRINTQYLIIIEAHFFNANNPSQKNGFR
jgi:hypothetical protein